MNALLQADLKKHAHLTQLRIHAQFGIRDRLFKQAGESNEELWELGCALAAECGCKPLHGPIKKKDERATFKVEHEYGNDWYELKDAVRMTIVAPTDDKLAELRAA